MGLISFTAKFISHRGNVDEKRPDQENNPDYIMAALKQGYEVEIDLWVKDKILYSGHDEPQYQIHRKFLDNTNFWIHCKNVDALDFCRKCSNQHFNYFWHDNDAYTLTSKGYVWVYPGQNFVSNCIAVLPERNNIKFETLKKNWGISGICSDRISEYRKASLNKKDLGFNLEDVI
jgi:hypothetical protein